MAATPETLHSRDEILALEDRITELAAHIHAATFRLLELIREYDERNGWVGPGLKSCAHWLNWRCGIGLGAAREKVRVAHAIKDLPKIRADFREGKVSYSKVRAMTRVATPENEEELLHIARHGTASHVELLVRSYRRVQRFKTLEAENERHDLRELDFYVDNDGCWVFHGRLTPEEGLRVVQAVEAAMEDSQQEHKDVSAETFDGPQVRQVSERIATRRADALSRLAENYLGSAGGGSTGGDRCTLNLHTDLDTLKADGEGAESELDRSGNVSAETSRRLSCDATVVHWLENHKNEPLNIGRKTRTIPPAIRRALIKRDQCCRFPGCTTSRFVDAHHIRHWADGGETRLDNLVLLCRHHHRLVHETGFGVTMQSDGNPKFTTPGGQTLPPVHPKRFRGNVFALTAANQREGLAIGPETPVPDWHGERMDVDLVLEVLKRDGAHTQEAQSTDQANPAS